LSATRKSQVIQAACEPYGYKWKNWHHNKRQSATNLVSDDIKFILKPGSAGKLTAAQSLPNAADVSPVVGKPLTFMEDPVTISDNGDEERNPADRANAS